MIEVPVPTRVPPQDPVYHFHAVALFNEPPDTLIVVLFVPQFTVADALNTGSVGGVQVCRKMETL